VRVAPLLSALWIGLAPLALAAEDSATGAPGELVAVGSETLSELVRLWGEDLREAGEPVALRFDARGSSTAPPALIDGVADLGPMSREMKPIERQACRRRFGRAPSGFRVALDGLRVFVAESNPIRGITLAQLDSLYSSTRRCSGGDAIDRWEDLGVNGEWGPRKIVPCGRNANSGTYSFFRERALCGGRFRADLIEQPGGASVVHWVRSGACGIGYGGLGREPKGVRALPLAVEAGGPFSEPTPMAIDSGAYPLRRALRIYVRPDLEPERRARVRRLLVYALSEPGQARAAELGFVALPPEGRERERAALRASLGEHDDD
jgi:phosphate transport system substrate-binding protein